MPKMPELPDHLFIRVKEDYSKRGDRYMFVLLMEKRKGWFRTRNVELSRDRTYFEDGYYNAYEPSERAIAQTATRLYAEYTDKQERINKNAWLSGDYPPKTL